MSIRLNIPAGLVALAAVILLACPGPGLAQVQYTEDFTGATSNNTWFFYNGACLTAGSSTSLVSPGYIPGCSTVLTSYYYPVLATLGKTSSDNYLTGGDRGFLGSATAPPANTNVPDSLPVAGNPNSGGALRFTNGAPYGYHENGAIVSNFVFPTSQGLSITFKTVTYHGDNQYGHGADGISFYLLDGCMPISGGGPVPTGCGTSSIYGTTTGFSAIGAWGGSLAYTCSNNNPPYDGLAGAYLGLGIDEWGNFLNGSQNTLNETGSTNTGGDNTASGGLYQAGRIGLRGAGNISWQALTNAYGTYRGSSTPYYPASMSNTCYIKGGTYSAIVGYCQESSNICGLTFNNVPYCPTDAMIATRNTCANATLYNYSSSSGTVSSNSVRNPTAPATTSLTDSNNTAKILDYLAMPNAYKVVSGFSIANESATIRGSTLLANTSSNDANPITYKLKITQDGLASLSYSYNGGTWQPVITGQNITSSNGALPSYFRFGFAGSTGGSTNIHEVMCFKAIPNETSQSSGGVNVYQNPTVKTGTQLYLANYFPTDWTGQLTAQSIAFDTTANKLVIASVPNWDARCVLTGVSTTTGACSTGVTSLSPEAPSSRVILTWNGTQGIPFEWANLTASQKSTLDFGDAAQTSNRLAYLRGDRTNEITSAGTCPQGSLNLACFRIRDNILGDIVDSSPLWVGPPQTYDPGMAFTDKLWGSLDSASETSYDSFRSAQQGRLNVVYVGANDGLLHGFRSGSLDANGNLIDNSTTPNDGYEVLAYMPAAILQTIHSSTPELDLANTQYSHNWFVDAAPASGDLFYRGAWHTWLVGGLGAGGAAIYALDITNPGNFVESAAGAQSTVVGEWSAANISCVGISNCQQNLGSTYGTPQIRRFHNGSWGVIFGNGYGSPNNAAGVFIMLIDPSSGAKSFYWLAAPVSGSAANGIANPASADIDLDHIVDYIYAGDLQGNVWRFDVTSTDPTKWAVTGSSPLFKTPSGAPITAGLTVSVLRKFILQNGGISVDTSTPARVVVNFGTGQQIPQSLTASAQYPSGSQYMFGVWDWNFNAAKTASQPGWNNISNVPVVALDPNRGPGVIQLTNLQMHTVSTVTQSAPATSYRTVSQEPVCWVVYETLDASSTCANPGTKYGWYWALPATLEQIIFNPVISPDGELVVNTYIPVQDSPLSCQASGTSTGFSMAVAPGTGSADFGGTGSTVQSYYTVNGNLQADGLQLNGTGIPTFLSSGQKADHNTEYLITQSSGGAAPPVPVNRHTVVAGKRLNWVQRR